MHFKEAHASKKVRLEDQPINSTNSSITKAAQSLARPQLTSNQSSSLVGQLSKSNVSLFVKKRPQVALQIKKEPDETTDSKRVPPPQTASNSLVNPLGGLTAYGDSSDDSDEA